MKLFCQTFSKTAPTPPKKPLHQRSRSRSCFWRSRSPAKQALGSSRTLLEWKDAMDTRILKDFVSAKFLWNWNLSTWALTEPAAKLNVPLGSSKCHAPLHSTDLYCNPHLSLKGRPVNLVHRQKNVVQWVDTEAATTHFTIRKAEGFTHDPN